MKDRGITLVEAIAWGIFGLGAIIYVITFVMISNARYGQDLSAAASWMSFAGAIAGSTFPAALILTGVRHLLPRSS
ncbi:hypothetical protein [Microbacterium paludicola]|uniref:hypothetical protein n=1 Tax=Microbacterium paludicola TaxID=300019 RepID=UPI00119E7CF4|nr:hypothetical protein [Microbacterium paludicola]